MYLQFYGLAEPPFSITPDPRFVFLSERHRDALAHLLYGIGQGGSGGFVQLTGEVGTGKTTLCRLLLEQMPSDTRVALVLNPRLSPVELVETICEELKLEVEPVRGSLKGLVDRLNAYLLRAYGEGLRVVLIIDEAQNLSFEALEQVRLLTNLETSTQKLLQIILLGQPELRETLARAELRQLTQRITARFHLTPLSAEETEDYLRHRLAVAGCPRFPFSRLAVRRIHQHAGGVPRLINVIADRALTHAAMAEIGLVAGDGRAVAHGPAQAAAGHRFAHVGRSQRQTSPSSGSMTLPTCVKPLRRRPTTFTLPQKFMVVTVNHGSTSRTLPAWPLSMAPVPTRTNWCRLVLPDMSTRSASSTWPASSEPLPMMHRSPTWQSCPACEQLIQ